MVGEGGGEVERDDACGAWSRLGEADTLGVITSVLSAHCGAEWAGAM